MGSITFLQEKPHTAGAVLVLGSAIVDIFKLENGKIVEHRDVRQAVPEKTASGNPMF